MLEKLKELKSLSTQGMNQEQAYSLMKLKADTYMQSSKLLTFMLAFQQKACQFPANVISLDHVKPANRDKKYKEIFNLCETFYSYHNLPASTVHDYKSTLILQGTQQSLQFLVKAAALYQFQLEQFYEKSKLGNKIQELAQYYKDTFTEKPKDVLGLLLDDLFLQCQAYGFEMDKPYFIDMYKEELETLKQNLK